MRLTEEKGSQLKQMARDKKKERSKEIWMNDNGSCHYNNNTNHNSHEINEKGKWWIHK